VSDSIPSPVAWSDGRFPQLRLRGVARRAADEGPPILVAAIVVWCFLALAVWWDVRALRIPNALTFPALAAALVWAGIDGGWAGAGAAALSAALTLALLFLPFYWGWLGAGDVKAALVLAACWGVEAFLPAFWWMLAVGGVLAIAIIAARGELLDLLQRWGRSAWLSLAGRRVVYVPPAEDSAAGGGLPFAVAIGLGAAAYGVWGWPWA
jgi:prepilin peptidase CpaA